MDFHETTNEFKCSKVLLSGFYINTDPGANFCTDTPQHVPHSHKHSNNTKISDCASTHTHKDTMSLEGPWQESQQSRKTHHLTGDRIFDLVDASRKHAERHCRVEQEVEEDVPPVPTDAYHPW